MGKPGIPERSVSRIMGDYLLSGVMISLRYQYAIKTAEVPCPPLSALPSTAAAEPDGVDLGSDRHGSQWSLVIAESTHVDEALAWRTTVLCALVVLLEGYD